VCTESAGWYKLRKYVVLHSFIIDRKNRTKPQYTFVGVLAKLMTEGKSLCGALPRINDLGHSLCGPHKDRTSFRTKESHKTAQTDFVCFQWDTFYRYLKNRPILVRNPFAFSLLNAVKRFPRRSKTCAEGYKYRVKYLKTFTLSLCAVFVRFVRRAHFRPSAQLLHTSPGGQIFIHLRWWYGVDGQWR